MGQAIHGDHGVHARGRGEQAGVSHIQPRHLPALPGRVDCRGPAAVGRMVGVGGKVGAATWLAALGDSAARVAATVNMQVVSEELLYTAWPCLGC